jgi:hypothetical protein
MTDFDPDKALFQTLGVLQSLMAGLAEKVAETAAIARPVGSAELPVELKTMAHAGREIELLAQACAIVVRNANQL